jgi:hypothetical protein
LTTDLNGKSEEHEDQTEHEWESELMGGVLQWGAGNIVDPDLQAFVRNCPERRKLAGCQG